MRTTIFLLTFLVYSLQGKAQERTEINVDSMLVNIDQSTFTSGILYERVMGLAQLKTFNDTIRPSHHKYFKQALLELYRASNKEKFYSTNELENFYTPDSLQNQVNIGIINATFHTINYDPENIENGALDIGPDSLFVQINDNPPFLPNHVFIASPLKLYVVGEYAVFNFKPDLLLQSTEDKNILSLVADFGTQQSFTIIEGGQILQENIEIQYTESGIKTLEFTATFEDGSSLTTVGVLNFNLLTNLPPPNGIKNGYVIASVPFKGYGSNDPTLPGYIKYRVFYHKVNDVPVATLLKPIVIIDGFDPGDKRQIEDTDPHPGKTDAEHVSIVEMMTYGVGSNTVEIVPLLRNLGYDVVIVNHPKYQMFGVDVDGGADYIERNALAHVKLYQELNAELAQNSSTEQLVIVGPSMGGQISRYALAYMEKNNIPTNTRLWVSVDSPHLGANIPVGAQTLLNMLNDYADSAEAEDFVNNQLGSPAAKQQLIEQHKTTYIGNPPFVVQSTTVGQDWLNARTVSQGYNINRGHLFFKTYYDNLYGNGISGSNGYPQNLRKIALVNGSLTNTKAFANPFSPGATNFTTPYLDYYSGNGAQVFKMEGYANVIGHIVTMETYFMPTTGTNHKIAYYKQKKFLGWNYHDRFISNYNSRGNMDNIPGGWFPTQRDLTYSVENSTPCDWVGFHEPNWGGYICVNDWNLQTLKHVNSFIPTASSLGFINPDFNWAQEFDRNLVCPSSKEIPFDSYFGPRNNEQHTSFTEASVTWLLAELAGNPQPPTIYLDGNDLDGPTKLCYGTTATYSFAACKSNPVQSWQYSTNLLNLVSSTYSSISVQPKNSSSSGLGYIRAIYPNQTVQKDIWIGKSNFNFDIDWDSAANMVNLTAIGPSGSDISLQGITNMTWQKIGGSGGGYVPGGSCTGFSCTARGPANSNWTVDFKVTATSSCGTTIKYITATPPPPLVSTGNGTYDFISNPNNLYTINYIENDVSSPVENFENPQSDFKIFVYNFTGNKVMETKETRIDISRLRPGIYILKAVIDDNVLTKKVFR